MADLRPDLAAQDFKKPNYIGHIFMPPFSVQEKVGDFSYRNITADSTAQTGRSNAAAPTIQTIDSSSTSFTCIETIDRINADTAEVLLHGGLANWQELAARVGKRNVLLVLEKLIAAQVLAGASSTVADILNDFIGAVETAYESVADYANGQIALVGSRRVLRRVTKYAEVIARMLNTGVILSSVKDVRNISNEQLAGVCGVDLVIEGPLDAWYTASATYQDHLAVIAIPDPTAHPLEEVQFGRSVTYDQDGIFEVSTYLDDNLRAETVDVASWQVLVNLNPECCYILDGCDALNAASTTTTTTTS